jgi:hypothetical protein
MQTFQNAVCRVRGLIVCQLKCHLLASVHHRKVMPHEPESYVWVPSCAHYIGKRNFMWSHRSLRVSKPACSPYSLWPSQLCTVLAFIPHHLQFRTVEHFARHCQRNFAETVSLLRRLREAAYSKGGGPALVSLALRTWYLSLWYAFQQLLHK